MSELYNTEILRLATQIPHDRRLADPDCTITRTSRICGSRITLDVKFDKGAIADIGMEVKACALGQAAAAIAGDNLIGERAETLAPVAAQMRAMLKEGGPPPTGKWEKLSIFMPARDHKSRHPSIMLALDAAMGAFEDAGPAKDAGAQSAPVQ